MRLHITDRVSMRPFHHAAPHDIVAGINDWQVTRWLLPYVLMTGLSAMCHLLRQRDGPGFAKPGSGCREPHRVKESYQPPCGQ